MKYDNTKKISKHVHCFIKHLVAIINHGQDDKVIPNLQDVLMDLYINPDMSQLLRIIQKSQPYSKIVYDVHGYVTSSPGPISRKSREDLVNKLLTSARNTSYDPKVKTS